jgi:pyruvate/2-oxoglutarate dehydrogenase complex dihydrolipoamide acyltransferase (E2) component
MARNRFDGIPVPNVHPVRRIMPFIMPTRNGAFVLFEQEIATAPLAAFLAQVNGGRPAGREVTMFHCVLRAIGIAMSEFPRLNRFVSGSRLYERRGIWLAFSAKQRLEKDAPLFTSKVEFTQGEPIEAFVDRVLDALGEGRSGKETATDREIKTFLRLPGPVLRAAVRLQRLLDGWNVYPAKLLEGDPLYASAFVVNLGSVGLDAAFHHLYEYGTIPIFATMGRFHRAPVVFENGSVGSREVFRLRYTYDERVEDGFYAARALERLAACLADPGALR